jgi:cyclase
MVAFRVIAKLDIKNANVVKGIQFEGLRVMGPAAKLAEKYSLECADEILFYDVVASTYKRDSLFGIVQEIARTLRIPITVVGGIRTLDDAQNLFKSGADKIGINSGAIDNPNLFSEISNRYGAQAVVCSIEAKKTGSNWNCMRNNGRDPISLSVLERIDQLNSEHVGEVLLTSIDKDGTRTKPDYELLRLVREKTELPLIYSGGIDSPPSVYECFQLGADGVGIASALHYETVSVPEIKSHLISKRVEVRNP